MTIVKCDFCGNEKTLGKLRLPTDKSVFEKMYLHEYKDLDMCNECMDRLLSWVRKNRNSSND